MDVQKNNPPPNAKTSERLATSHLCKKGKDVNYAAIKNKQTRQISGPAANNSCSSGSFFSLSDMAGRIQAALFAF